MAARARSPGFPPGSKSTSRSTSLSGRLVPLSTEPNSDSFRIPCLRQKSPSLSSSTGNPVFTARLSELSLVLAEHGAHPAALLHSKAASPGSLRPTHRAGLERGRIHPVAEGLELRAGDALPAEVLQRLLQRHVCHQRRQLLVQRGFLLLRAEGRAQLLRAAQLLVPVQELPGDLL